MNYLDTTNSHRTILNQYIFFVLLVFFSAHFIGCSPAEIIVHNKNEAVDTAQLELNNVCKRFGCTPSEFDAPVLVEDMSNDSDDYAWSVRFSKINNTEVGVSVLVSKYGKLETSFLTQDEYNLRQDREAKDRKENPWKYN